MNKEKCEWCGGILKLQPSVHVENNKAFCNTTCAYEYRLSTQPVEKQKTS